MSDTTIVQYDESSEIPADVFHRRWVILGVLCTSLMIIVSVTMDTVTQIQSHLLAHQYEGLIRKSKLRGRRK